MLLIMPMAFKTYSQDEKINLGVKGGLNIATLSGLSSASASYGGSSSSTSNSPELLPHLGVYSEFKLGNVLSFQPEILFSMKGYHSKSTSTVGSNSSTYETNVRLSYIDIPLQLRFNLGKGFNILAGPYVGFLVGANSKSTSTANNVTSTSTDKTTTAFNKTQIGLNLGVGYQFDMGLGIAATFNKGFSKVYENFTNTSNVFQISLSYRLAKF
jgi:hypothetical protein